MPPTERDAPTQLSPVWPALPQAAWSDTCATLQLWMQVVGKIRLALVPHLNHCWNVTLYPTVRGLTTGPMPHGTLLLQIDFDFFAHTLVVETSAGARRTIPLKPMTVAVFYGQLMAALQALGAAVRIWKTPCEVLNPIAFDQDHAVSRALSRQGEPGSSVLGSARPGLHAFLRPNGAAASQHGRPARPRHARRLLARGEQLRILARRARHGGFFL